MKVFLLNPPTGRYMRSDRCQAPVDSRVAEEARPPMDLAYMAAVVARQGGECMIKDYPMQAKGWGRVAGDIASFMPDLVVVSVTTPTFEHDLRACDIAKKINPLIRTIAKGAHFLVFDKEVLSRFSNLDLVIRGEPEITLSELASGKEYSQIPGITFRKGSLIVRNSDRPFLDDLDALPFPARDLLDNTLYRTPDTQQPIAFITTSRGCPGRCVFCAAELVAGHTIRARKVDAVLREIRECLERYHIGNFFFSADTFTWDKKWVIELCKGIVQQGLKIRWGANSRVDTLDEELVIWMKRAGCYVIGFGAESGSQPMLDKMKKGITVAQTAGAVNICRKHGMDTFLIFVIGLPWEDKDTIARTLEFVRNSRAAFIEVNIAYPLPGTEYYDTAKKENLFDESDLLGHNYSVPLVRSLYLSTAELKNFRKKILSSFYLRPGYILGRIMRINSWRLAGNTLKYAVRLVKNLFTT
jgi:anaerobic magnesium-protoporphyrin IX monomethyl ester cyclase